MDETVSLTAAKPKDALYLKKFLSSPIIDHSFVKPLSQRDITIDERVDRCFGDGTWVLAKKKAQIVGCVSIAYNKRNKTSVVSTLVVHPAYRNRGVGTMISKYAIELAALYSPKKILTDSWEGNKIAARIFEALGFERAAVFEDPKKRPPGTMTIQYKLDRTALTRRSDTLGKIAPISLK